MLGGIFSIFEAMCLNHNICAYIRVCGRTLLGLAHAAPPTQYKPFIAFSTNWLFEGSTSTYSCKEQQSSRPG